MFLSTLIINVEEYTPKMKYVEVDKIVKMNLAPHAAAGGDTCCIG